MELRGEKSRGAEGPAERRHQPADGAGLRRTIEQAARSAGVSESTAYRRLREPEFCQRLDEVRAEMAQCTASMLAAAGMEAVKTLLALQQAPVPAATRLGAARVILALGIRFRETAESAQWRDRSIEELKMGPGCHLEVLTDANWFSRDGAGQTPSDPGPGPTGSAEAMGLQ